MIIKDNTSSRLGITEFKKKYLWNNVLALGREGGITTENFILASNGNVLSWMMFYETFILLNDTQSFKIIDILGRQELGNIENP